MGLESGDYSAFRRDYFADRLLRMIEQRRGGIMPHRQIVFFVIFLALALVGFQLMQMLLGKPGGP